MDGNTAGGNLVVTGNLAEPAALFTINGNSSYGRIQIGSNAPAPIVSGNMEL